MEGLLYVCVKLSCYNNI